MIGDDLRDDTGAPDVGDVPAVPPVDLVDRLRIRPQVSRTFSRPQPQPERREP